MKTQRKRIKATAEKILRCDEKEMSFYLPKEEKKESTAAALLAVSLPPKDITPDTLVRVSVLGKIDWVPYHRALGAQFDIIW